MTPRTTGGGAGCQIGRYALQERLGVGWLGESYLAADRRGAPGGGGKRGAHSYEAYEDEFREVMVECGLPVDKPLEPQAEEAPGDGGEEESEE